MKKIVIYYILVVLLFLLGTFLRFYQLGTIPDSLDWDEAAWGYNAYSILLTGKDEYGISFPISFKSFGDYKQPIYIYSEVPGIVLFGMNTFSTRLPSAIYGSLTCIGMFLLLRELFYRNTRKKELALVGMAVFALSPWSIQFSRIAFEATLGVCFVVFGLYVFLMGVRKSSITALVVSVLLFALSAYSYHSEKLFSPLFIAGLFVIYRKYFLQRKVIALSLLSFVFLSNAFWLSNSTTTARGASVLFTSAQTQLLKNSVSALAYDHQHYDTLGVLLDNRRIVYVNTFLLNYLKHWDPNWLFVLGDVIPRHHAPGMGLLYLLSLPGILFGIYYMFKNNYEGRYVILLWFLLAPVASALAIDAPNAERSLIMLPPFVVWEGIGVIQIFRWCTNKTHHVYIKRMMLGVAVCGFLLNISYYMNQYFNHTNYDVQQYWQYGYQQVVEYTNQPQFANKQIIFSSQFEQPYIFYLFYSHYNPAIYQKAGGSNITDRVCYAINNRYFGNCNTLVHSGSIVVTLQDNPTVPSKKLYTAYYLNGQPAASVYQVE